MLMLPTPFLEAQKNQSFRDVLNFINGFLASHSILSLYLEPTDGEKEKRKLNYRIGTRTIITVWILKDKFRVEIRDPKKHVESNLLYESGNQFESEGWRNYKFDPLDLTSLSQALKIVHQCATLYEHATA